MKRAGGDLIKRTGGEREEGSNQRTTETTNQNLTPKHHFSGHRISYGAGHLATATFVQLM
jgi:hypothetical protein